MDDPGSTGLFYGIGSATYRSPSPFIISATHSSLVGYRTHLAKEAFFSDEWIGSSREHDNYLAALSQPDNFLNEETGLRPTERSSDFVLNVGERQTKRMKGNHLVLCSHEPDNYGSLLFRVVAKAASVRPMALGKLPVVAPLPFANASELLQLAGFSADQIIPHDRGMITQLDRAVIPGLRNPHAYLDPESARLFQKIAAATTSIASTKRIYISRLSHALRGGSTRVMQNEQELVEKLKKLDFEIVEPEKLNILEQISIFRSAKLILGPSGSAMFNAVFCRPGTKIIDIESEPHWLYAHTGIFSSCGMRYGLFAGVTDPSDTRPVHRRWSVHIDHLINRIKDFSAD